MKLIKVQPIPLGVSFSKAQSSKFEHLFCHVSVRREVRALSFELRNSIRKCHPKWDRLYIFGSIVNHQSTARFVEDETRNAELNGNRNPEWWGDFSQLYIQIKQKSQFEFVPRDTSEFKSNQNLNSTLYREIPRYFMFSILTS